MSVAVKGVLEDRLTRYDRRRRRWVLIRAASLAIACWIVAILVVTWIDALWVLERWTRSLLTLSTYALAAGLFLLRSLLQLRGRPLHRAALAIEQQRPELRDRLLSAVELAGSLARGSAAGSRAFIEAAQRDVAWRLRRVDVRDLLPVRLLRRPLAVAAVLLAVVASLTLIPNLHFSNRLARAIVPGIDLDRVSRTRIVIRVPDPASTVVPAEQLSAVRVETHGYPATSGQLQWQCEDGTSGTIDLRKLEGEPSTTAEGRPMSTLAANLPVGTSPLQYRILAGDGLTAWHRLDPNPRPSLIGLEFRVQPPAYARLPAETFSSSSGELRLLEGSRVRLTARFDMPVVDAELRLVSSDQRIAMSGDAEHWQVGLQIEGDDRYQVLARSAETGFDNSLSPQYQIVALPDLPPQAAWMDDANGPRRPEETDRPSGRWARGDREEPRPQRRLITSRSILSLAAQASDEMPIDKFFQESSLNGGPWQRQQMGHADEPPPAEQTVVRRWSWDVTELAGDDPPAPAGLQPGDLIRTRAVAIDRKGQQGQSAVREYLISDQTLDARRRENLDHWIVLVDASERWAEAMQHELIELGIETPADAETAPDVDADSDDDAETESPQPQTLAELTGQLLQRLVVMTRGSLHDSEVGQLESLGRSVTRITADLERARDADDDQRGGFAKLNRAAQTVHNAARQLTAHQLAVTVADDLDRMTRAMAPLVDPDSGIQWESFSRYHEITLQQLREVRQLLSGGQAAIPDSSFGHNEQLVRWIDGWLSRLADNISPDASEQRVRGTTQDLFKDVSGRRRYGMLDGRLPSRLVESHNQLHDIGGLLTPQLQAAHQLARRWERLGDSNDDSDRVRERLQLETELQRRLATIAKRLDSDAEMNLRRPEADRRYVADARLMRRVLDVVNEDDFSPPDERRLHEVLAEITAAYHILEAGHLWHQWLLEMRTLADTERWDIDSATARLDAPLRWERVQRGLNHALTAWERAGLDWELRRELHNLVHGSDMSRIASSITSRRWQQEPAVSLADDLDARHQELVAAGQALAAPLDDARRQLQAYLPDLSAMARDTAKSLRQAEQAARGDDRTAEQEAEQAAQRMRQLQQQFNRQAEQLRDALVDEANTQDLTTDDGIRRARDADIATRAIDQQVGQASAATEQALAEAGAAENESLAEAALGSAADPLADAADALQQIASHFDPSREAGIDQSEDAPPPSLAALAEQLGLADQLDEDFARSESLAKALQTDPKEMLEKLTRELQRNAEMREELSRVAEQSVRDAQRALEQQAHRERSLQLELERQDPRVLAEKRRLEDALRTATDFAAAVQRSMLHTAKQASRKLDDSTLPAELAPAAQQQRVQLDQTSDRLQQVARQAESVRSAEQALLAELRRKTESLRQQLDEAVESLRQGETAIGQLSREPEAALDESQRGAEQRDMQSLQRQGRDALASSLRSLQNRANQAAGSAEQQTRQVRSQVQRAERLLNEASEKLDQHPDDDQRRQQQQQAQARLQTERLRLQLAEEEAKRRRDLANQARDRHRQVGRTPLPPLDSPRPAGELVEAMLGRAAEQLQEQAQALAEADQRAEQTPPTHADAEQLDSSRRVQQQVQAEVGRAAENLQRAARHQDRLGDDAGPLQQLADRIAEVAQQPVARARQTLDQAAEQVRDDPQQASAEAQQAIEQLGQAEAAIAEQAEQLVETLAQMQQQAAAPDQDDAAVTPARQMARTLDELDRTLTQSRPEPTQPDAPTPPDQPGDGPPGDAEPGQPGDAESEPPDAQPPSADGAAEGDADLDPADTPSPSGQSQANSPTLDSSARRQMQQMAMRRTLPGEAEAGDAADAAAGEEASGETDGGDGQPGEGQAQTSGPGSEGVAPDRFPLDDVDRDTDGDWGRLRELEAEDTSVQRRIEVSPQFRRQVEAYFRIIADQGRQQ